MVRAVICGPPCETWAVARFRQIFHALGKPKKGPRPVRSVDMPFGISKLTPAEYQQLEVGNRLLFVALEIFVIAHRFGACGLIEHPAPGDCDKPSIFKTETVQRIKN